jgi:hypothetical protein
MNSKKRGGKLSLQPLTLEEALRAALKVDPEKIPPLPKKRAKGGKKPHP